MVEYEPLHKKEIYTQCNVVVMLQYGCWYWHGNEGWSAWCSFGPGHFSFEDSNVGAIDKECSFGIVWCHRTVPNEVLSEDRLELDLIRPPNFSVQIPSVISQFDFPMRKHFFLLCYCVDHGVRVDTVTSSVRVENIESGRVFNKLHDRSVKSVYKYGWFLRCIHGYLAYFAHIGK